MVVLKDSPEKSCSFVLITPVVSQRLSLVTLWEWLQKWKVQPESSEKIWVQKIVQLVISNVLFDKMQMMALQEIAAFCMVEVLAINALSNGGASLGENGHSFGYNYFSKWWMMGSLMELL